MVVHPGHGNYSGTLVNALAWHFKDNPDYDADDPRMGLVHRIDKDTSGLLVVAKTPDAKTALGRQFFEKTTKREYMAVVWGCPSPRQGTIVGNIGRSLSDLGCVWMFFRKAASMGVMRSRIMRCWRISITCRRGEMCA